MLEVAGHPRIELGILVRLGDGGVSAGVVGRLGYGKAECVVGAFYENMRGFTSRGKGRIYRIEQVS